MRRKQIDKGAIAEELLKSYFLERGYYVLRGVNVNYEKTLITDIDIFLYKRSSHFNVERINVDIKNKKVSKALERIFWTRGVKDILGFSNCMVATLDRRPAVKSFAKQHNVKLLDGNFMSKLKLNESLAKSTMTRLNEEELKLLFDRGGMDKMDGNWYSRLDAAKSRLIGEFTFNKVIRTLNDFEYFMSEYISRRGEEKEALLRALYTILSIVCTLVDGLSLNVVNEDEEARLTFFKSGFAFGDEGLDGFRKVFRMLDTTPLVQSSDLNLESNFETSLNSIPTTIISEYFAQQGVLNGLFTASRFFISEAYSKKLSKPLLISAEHQSLIYLLMDYYSMDRKLLD